MLRYEEERASSPRHVLLSGAAAAVAAAAAAAQDRINFSWGASPEPTIPPTWFPAPRRACTLGTDANDVSRGTCYTLPHRSSLEAQLFCLLPLIFIFVQPRSRRWRLLTRLNSMRAARNRPEIRAPLFHCTTTGHFVGGLRNEEDRSARYKMAPESIVLVGRSSSHRVGLVQPGSLEVSEEGV